MNGWQAMLEDRAARRARASRHEDAEKIRASYRRDLRTDADEPSAFVLVVAIVAFIGWCIGALIGVV